MFERLNFSTEAALAYRITLPLTRSETAKITAELEGAISAHGKIRILIDLQAFPYGELGALWEDLKFDVKHARDIDRLALVGGGKVEIWSTRVFGALPFTRCRCFGEGAGRRRGGNGWQKTNQESPIYAASFPPLLSS